MASVGYLWGVDQSSSDSHSWWVPTFQPVQCAPCSLMESSNNSPRFYLSTKQFRPTSISCSNLSICNHIKISDWLTKTAHRNYKTSINIPFLCYHTPDAADRTPLHQVQPLQIPHRRRTTKHGRDPRRYRPHRCHGRTRNARRRRWRRRGDRSRWISRRNRDARCKGDPTRRARTAKGRRLRRQRRIRRCFGTEGVQDTMPATSATTPPPVPLKEDSLVDDVHHPIRHQHILHQHPRPIHKHVAVLPPKRHVLALQRLHPLLVAQRRRV
jgi:hypothetical protein